MYQLAVVYTRYRIALALAPPPQHVRSAPASVSAPHFQSAARVPCRPSPIGALHLASLSASSLARAVEPILIPATGRAAPIQTFEVDSSGAISLAGSAGSVGMQARRELQGSSWRRGGSGGAEKKARRGLLPGGKMMPCGGNSCDCAPGIASHGSSIRNTGRLQGCCRAVEKRTSAYTN